jgi:hypothetical protein
MKFQEQKEQLESKELTTTKSRIELRELKIPMGYVHQFWVRYNSAGEIIGEIQGLPTDKEGNPLSVVISLYSVPLGAVVYPLASQPKAVRADTDGGFSGYYKIKQDSMIILQGNEDAIEARWQVALRAAEVLTKNNFTYKAFPSSDNTFDGNCNSVSRTIADVMGVGPQKISERGVPGQEKNLLPSHSFPRLYNNDLEVLDPSTYEVHLVAEESSCVIC